MKLKKKNLKKLKKKIRLRNIFNCVLLHQRPLTAGLLYNDFVANTKDAVLYQKTVEHALPSSQIMQMLTHNKTKSLIDTKTTMEYFINSAFHIHSNYILVNKSNLFFNVVSDLKFGCFDLSNLGGLMENIKFYCGF